MRLWFSSAFDFSPPGLCSASASMCVLYFRSTSLVTLSILYSPFLSLLSHLLRIIVASRNYSFLSSRNYKIIFLDFFSLVDEIFRIRVEKFLASFKLITFVETSSSRNFSYIFFFFFLGSLWNFYREKFDEMFMEDAVY